MLTTPQDPSPQLATFLQHLRVEEQLLADAIVRANHVYEALRRGDLTAATALSADQEALAAALHQASAARAAATDALALDLNISAPHLTLRALALSLPEPHNQELREVRERLTALATDHTAIQTRNANLIGHLRSFFRSVLADLTADDTPTRYGPTGNWLSPAPSPALLARGNPS